MRSLEVVLVERGDQVADMRRRGFGRSCSWISLGPGAADELEHMGWPYGTLSSVLHPGALERFCVNGHQEFLALCERLDAGMFDLSPELRPFDIRPFQFNMFSLLPTIDSVLYRFFALRSILAENPASRLHVHAEDAAGASRTSGVFSNDDNLWGAVAARFTPRVQLVPPTPRGAVGGTARWASCRRTLVDLMGRSVAATTLASCIRARDVVGVGDLPARGARRSLLILGGSHEWRLVARRLRHAGYRVLHARSDAFSCVVARAPFDAAQVLESREREALKRAFDRDGVSLYPLVRNRLWEAVRDCPTRVEPMRTRLEEIRDRWGVAALLTAGAATGLDNTIQQLARHLRVPVFAWQHGIVSSNGNMTQFCDYLNCMTASTTLTWGSQAARAHELQPDHAMPFTAAIVSTGSATLDEIRRSGIQRRARPVGSPPRRIVYAVTNYYENSWYYGMPPGIDDCELFRDQRMIVDTLMGIAKERDIEVMIKLHPSSEAKDPPFLDRMRRDVRVTIVKNRKTFSQLLTWTDAVVLDAPTTTLLQAMAAGLPVFVLLRHWRHSPEGEALLARRAVCSLQVDELCRRVRAYASGGLYPADASDTQFLEAYGTHRNDGQSAARAAEVVISRLRSASPTVSENAGSYDSRHKEVST